jgi:hypothetical protein
VISQLCWNLSLLPTEERDASLAEMRMSLNMDDDEFVAFRQSVVVPMIQRHHEMFPQLHPHSAKMPPRRGRPREKGRPPKSTLEPNRIRRVPAPAVKSTSSAVESVTGDSHLCPASAPLHEKCS